MKELLNRIIMGWWLACCLTACVKTEKPTSLPPEVWINEAEDVTRHTVGLSGGVRWAQEDSRQECHFLFGTSEQEMQRIETRVEGEQVLAGVSGLESGTDYYFCLEAGNDRQQVRSRVMTFRTLPDGPVVLGSLSLLGQTPVSLWMSCPIVDDGGGKIASVGFAYHAAGDAQETRISTVPDGEAAIQMLIPSLRMNTEYVIRAFAVNTMGSSYSEEFQITTGNAVTYEQAGLLSTVVGEADKYNYASISIQAPMNGDDFRFLRSMAGKGTVGEPSTSGRLEKIDLSGADIVAGGLSYDGSHFTEADVVSVGMFSGLPALKELVLPVSAVRVEEDAFGNCTALEHLTLPLKLEQIIASTGCTALKEITINPMNAAFATIDGLLYNKAGTELLWCPCGNKTERLTLPATLTHIKKFSFEGCAIREIVLPETVTSIESCAFAKSEIVSIVLPDKLERLDEGLFLQCGSLKKVTLGSRMAYVCRNAFSGSSLEELRVRATHPPVCDENAFAGINMEQCTVYVPKGTKTLYKGHRIWGRFIMKEMTE